MYLRAYLAFLCAIFHSGLVQFTTNNLLVFHILLLFNCVKSVQIQNFFWSVFSCTYTRKNSVSGYFSRSTKIKKYEILVKYLSYCTQNRAITRTYFKKHQRKLTQIILFSNVSYKFVDFNTKKCSHYSKIPFIVGVC